MPPNSFNLFANQNVINYFIKIKYIMSVAFLQLIEKVPPNLIGKLPITKVRLPITKVRFNLQFCLTKFIIQWAKCKFNPM